MKWDDVTLADLYTRRRAQRRASAGAATVPVETVHALATGSYIGSDREALVDAVLADEGMRAEFLFFRDTSRGRPARGHSVFRLGVPLALAASVVVAIALSTRTGGEDAGPLRGGDTAIVALTPGVSAPAGPITFAWRPVAGAVGYELEVTRDDGTSVVSERVADTTVTAMIPASAGSLQWWITVRYDDGRRQRSEVHRLTPRTP